MANESTNYYSTFDDRFSDYDGKTVFGNGSSPLNTFSPTSPKLVQGVAYLQSNNQLKIDIKSHDSYEFEPVVNIIDHDYNRKIDFEYKWRHITITYKNWTKKTASDKTLTLSFQSGFRKTIVLKVPGISSKLNDQIENITSMITTSPYENMLSLDFSANKRSSNSILGAVFPKKDPYDVYNYSGVYKLNLPFAHYTNSSYLNEIFVEQGVTSTNNDVDNGISNRGVGHLYSGREEQEIHFINLLTTNENIGTNQQLLNSVNTAPFTYSFVYASNLYFIADDAPEHQVCLDPRNPSFFLTSGNDCEGTSIGDYKNKRFVDGHCCNSNCDGFSMVVEDVSPDNYGASNNTGAIKVTVTGGAANYTYLLLKHDVDGIVTQVSSGSVSSTTHTFTGLKRLDQYWQPYQIQVADSNSCIQSTFIRLKTKNNESAKTACTDSGAANYDSTESTAGDSVCFFCRANDQYGNAYNGLTYGDDDSGSNRPVGVDFISNDGSVVEHAQTISGNGFINFKGKIFPPLFDHISSDSDEAYKIRVYSLGNTENANSKTNAEILAITPTATVATDKTFTLTREVAVGWWALEAYVENVPNVTACKSIHRFYVGYAGCTDSNANNFDAKATYGKQSLCQYDCIEEPIDIIINDTNQACVKSLSITRGPYDIINWIIGGERKQGFGPHLASEGDYVEVMVENTQTKCTQRGETHIRETNCNQQVSGTARMLIMQETAAMGGCTDQTASNYNCDAEWDDGSCIAAVYGCMDMTAANYNSNANVDNGQCVYGILGCTMPKALNYNPLTTIPDNDNCEFCPLFTVGGLGVALSFSGKPFEGDSEPTDIENAIQAGTFNLFATGQPLLTWELTLISTGAYLNYLPPNVVLKIYRKPSGGGTVQGYSSDQYTFPISETMDLVPIAETKVTGLDSQNYNNTAFGTWDSNGGLDPSNLWQALSQPLDTVNENIGYGSYIIELGIPQEGGKICYNYEIRFVGGTTLAYDSPSSDTALNVNTTPPLINVTGASREPDNIGCFNIYAKNYTGYGSESKNIVYNLIQDNTTMPDENNWFILSTGSATDQGICEFELDQPECLPRNRVQKQKYITDCMYNGVGNWYTRLLGGSKDNCEDRNLAIMSFIKYLTDKNGLDCIHNCADSGTPNYPKKKTCEDVWKEGGSIEFTVDPTTGQGNGVYGLNTYVKYNVTLPWLGDVSPGTFHIANNDCGSQCGNPYGNGARNWDICVDPKIITETTNYLDKFYKFASEYCKSCNPCSYIVGNNNTVIGSNVEPIEPYTYNIVDNGIQVGGINIEVDGDDITTDDSI